MDETLAAGAHSGKNHIGRLVCLVGDDDKLAAELTGQLGHFGYQVSVFSCDRESMPALTSKIPQALVIDTVMSGENAVSLPEEIEQFRIEHQVPVIFISDQDDNPGLF